MHSRPSIFFCHEMRPRDSGIPLSHRVVLRATRWKKMRTARCENHVICLGGEYLEHPRGPLRTLQCRKSHLSRYDDVRRAVVRVCNAPMLFTLFTRHRPNDRCRGKNDIFVRHRPRESYLFVRRGLGSGAGRGVDAALETRESQERPYITAVKIHSRLPSDALK